MACPTMTFEGVDRDVWDCLRGAARSRIGIDLPDRPSGTASEHGATVDWVWSEGDGTLELTVRQKPDFIDCATIDESFRQAVRSCGGR
ncbi:MAG TPA: hypothetical protein VHG91_14035 [Longimicrobium sp.]|nr:hypothetical protein [Longimicrobium sp.]